MARRRRAVRAFPDAASRSPSEIGSWATCSAAVAADLIENRAQHDSVQELNESLRRRTAELEASRDQLARQAAELTEQDRNREEFLAALGHELRNPLSAIQSSVAVVQVADDRSRKALAVLERQMQHMTRLINDLLDMTRVRHGTVRLERQADGSQSGGRARRSTRRGRAPTARACGSSSMLPQTPVIVDADPERVAQILDNLLRNAIGYTDEGTITLRVQRRRGCRSRRRAGYGHWHRARRRRPISSSRISVAGTTAAAKALDWGWHS